jgi:hypothetical protein
VRVNNHQIGFISTHRKIGHSPSISAHCRTSGREAQPSVGVPVGVA